jgi:hypothetical protein
MSQLVAAEELDERNPVFPRSTDDAQREVIDFLDGIFGAVGACGLSMPFPDAGLAPMRPVCAAHPHRHLANADPSYLLHHADQSAEKPTTRRMAV